METGDLDLDLDDVDRCEACGDPAEPPYYCGGCDRVLCGACMFEHDCDEE